MWVWKLKNYNFKSHLKSQLSYILGFWSKFPIEIYTDHFSKFAIVFLLNRIVLRDVHKFLRVPSKYSTSARCRNPPLIGPLFCDVILPLSHWFPAPREWNVKLELNDHLYNPTAL